MADQRLLTNTGKRIRDELELGEVYTSWMVLAAGYERAALHAMLKELLVILVIMAVSFILNRGIEHLFQGKDKLRASTVRMVLKFSVQFIAALIILFIILGVPSQMTTILGLAGAGLTVALKDFIVAFFGWFILMGRNGIRVGDWVEIKGVGGEVVEVGLLRTVLLETGSWSDSGHPTGRRVAFVNSFAMEGHYFNFSTSGQWMWDELKALVPVGVDPYPLIDAIHQRVAQETEANAQQAEKEWSQATKRYRVQAFSATPGINVAPTANGIEIRVRYITRAFERHETRRNLYHAVVELMHGKRPVETSDTPESEQEKSKSDGS
jgi:small-conductance mechanosensitive channel